MDITKSATANPAKAIPISDGWSQRPWVRATEGVIWHIVAVIVGLVMMVVGLGLGVTMILLPVGIVVGLLGMAIFVGGLFARIQSVRPGGRS
jgi:hypothetical protein